MTLQFHLPSNKSLRRNTWNKQNKTRCPPQNSSSNSPRRHSIRILYPLFKTHIRMKMLHQKESSLQKRSHSKLELDFYFSPSKEKKVKSSTFSVNSLLGEGNVIFLFEASTLIYFSIQYTTWGLNDCVGRCLNCLLRCTSKHER